MKAEINGIEISQRFIKSGAKKQIKTAGSKSHFGYRVYLIIFAN